MGDDESGRATRVETLASLLYQHCICQDRAHFEATGTVTPTGSLRHKATRQCLTFAKNLTGRWYTQKMVKDALDLMIKQNGLSVPEVPGFSMKGWLEEQSKILQPLLSRARRSTIKDEVSHDEVAQVDPAKPSAMADPDNAETQAWMPDPAEDWRLHRDWCLKLKSGTVQC